MPSQQLSERPETSTATAGATKTRHEFRGATIEEAIGVATEELGPRIRIVEAAQPKINRHQHQGCAMGNRHQKRPEHQFRRWDARQKPRVPARD